MHLTLLSGEIAVCRLPAHAPWPQLTASEPILAITRTPSELSIVCAATDAPTEAQVERGWNAFGVEGPMDFSLVGVVSSITSPLANANIGVFVISTFDTDYLLVKAESMVAAADALRAAGHRVAT